MPRMPAIPLTWAREVPYMTCFRAQQILLAQVNNVPNIEALRDPT